jgi:hypothetical protein
MLQRRPHTQETPPKARRPSARSSLGWSQPRGTEQAVEGTWVFSQGAIFSGSERITGDSEVDSFCLVPSRRPHNYRSIKCPDSALSMRGLACLRHRTTRVDLCGDWFVTGGIRLPFLPTRWSATQIPESVRIRVEAELRLTTRESR